MPHAATLPTPAIMGPRILLRYRPVDPITPSPPSPPMAANRADTTFELVLRARDGDTSAVDEICTRYIPRLNRWARGRLPAWARGALDTQDLVQDTLVQVVKRLDQFDPKHEGAFQAYARQALLNRIRDEIRRAQRKPAGDVLDTSHPSREPSPLEEAIGQQALERYEAALQRLRPEEREAVVLRVEFRHSMAEIAAAMGKPSAAAAHMAVSRALVRLAEEMAHGRQA